MPEAGVDLIREIEQVAFRAWVPFETEEYDGWLLRYAGGFSRRSNSVYPEAASTLRLGEKLEYCRDWYAARGLGLVVRQTPASEAGIDARLEELGFTFECPTDVMVAPLDRSFPMDGVAITDAPDREWLEAAAPMIPVSPHLRSVWERILAGVEATPGFATIRDGADVVAVGVGVADGPWLGLFEIMVAPDHRRRGLGRRLTEALLEWGRERGAVRSYLQVVADNASALALYGGFGFTRAYTYWYRRAPSGS
jgi:N-acetylglutamate synthase